MKDLKVLSPSRIERLLELACAYNVPLFITAESGEKTYQYNSRMLERKKKPSANALIIDHPFTSGPAIALKPGIRISVSFALDDDWFLFESAIRGKTDFALANRKKIAAFEIAYPNMLSGGDRRSYYRVPAPMSEPISIQCGTIGGISDWFVQEAGAWNFPSHLRFEGRILDISVGGMLIGIEKLDRSIPDVGTKLGLRFSLAPNETPVTLKGAIKRIEKGSTGRNRIAVQFIDTAEKFEYKLSINRLYRHVAEQQRELTKSGGD